MRQLRILSLALVLLTLLPGRAAAQDARPPVEIGVGLTGIAAVPYEDFFLSGFALPGVEARVSIPASPVFSLEAGVSLGRRSDELFSRFEGIYFMQVKQRLESATRGRFQAFLTYGAAGYVERRTHIPSGRTMTGWDPPIALLVGTGVQHNLTPRLAVRADVQMATILWIPLGVRVSGGVSIPLGKY